MANPADLFPAKRTPVHGVPCVVSGAPASADDLVRVTWQSLDEETGEVEPVEEEARWAAREGRMPTEGDDGLLLVDGVADPWVLVWATGT